MGNGREAGLNPERGFGNRGGGGSALEVADLELGDRGVDLGNAVDVNLKLGEGGVSRAD